MATWKLWYALNHPPAVHPLFWRALRRYHRYPITLSTARLGWLDKLAITYLFGFMGLMFTANHVARGIQSVLLSVLVVLLAIPVILPVLLVLRNTVLSGSYYGLLWAFQINQLIVQERKNKTYDLLWLIPQGVLVPVWAMSMGCLYSNYRFNQLVAIHTFMLRSIACIAGIVLLIYIADPYDGGLFVAIHIVHTLALITALHFEFVQSLLLALLLGIITPHYTYSLFDARIWTLGGFLFIQFNVYAITALTGLFLMPAFTSHFALGQPLSTTVEVLFTMGVFYFTRELLLSFLWRWLLRLTATTALHNPDRLFSNR